MSPMGPQPVSLQIFQVFGNEKIKNTNDYNITGHPEQLGHNMETMNHQTNNNIVTNIFWHFA